MIEMDEIDIEIEFLDARIAAALKGPEFSVGKRDRTPEAAPAPAIDPPKGTCPKCGKHIGRGLHFHVKACGHDAG
jgi:hypothetical protein